jgi:mannosyl-3-phosphoglycerate phosphatase
MKTLLFTDIDGTLIDHYTYSHAIAKKSLKKLAAADVPVIFCSSKTFSEQLHLQRKMNINHPFIIENGSAVAIPKGYFPSLDVSIIHFSESHDLAVLAKKDVNDIQFAIEKINTLFNLNCYGYFKSGHKEIAQKTGLKGKAIGRAKERLFTESLLSDPPSPEALKTLESFGLSALQGGRFLTIQDNQVDKGKAVRLVIQFFQGLWGEKTRSIGIGDSPNDASLLQVVDLPFLVQKHDGSWANVEVKNLTKSREIGARGFKQMTDAIFRF